MKETTIISLWVGLAVVCGILLWSEIRDRQNIVNARISGDMYFCEVINDSPRKCYRPDELYKFIKDLK